MFSITVFLIKSKRKYRYNFKLSMLSLLYMYIYYIMMPIEPNKPIECKTLKL